MTDKIGKLGSLAVVAAAWIAVVHHAVAYRGHMHHHRMTTGEELFYWLTMVFAMMFPVIARLTRAVALRSMAERRGRAIAASVLGFLVAWLALGVAVAWLRELPWMRTSAAIAGTFAVAACWALLPARARAMAASHAPVPVLAPAGWEADRDCIRAGVAVGAACVTSCWAFMLGCALSGHHLVPMVVGAVIALLEARSFRPPRMVPRLAPLALAVFFLRAY